MTVLTTYLSAQTTCDIKEYYGDFIFIKKLSHKNKEYLTKGIAPIKNKTCFADVINNHGYISYLMTQFSSTANDSIMLKIKDSTVLQKEFIKFIKADTLFNRVMADLFAKTVEARIPKDTVSTDRLLNIAVKFFSIFSINEQGAYRGFVCSGRNDIAKTEKVRRPQFEAFCFSSIFEHISDSELNMQDEFVKAIKEIAKINLGVDNNEKLLRAQGAMFLLMRNNEKLKQVLKIEYEKNKNILPFILADKN